MAPAEDDPPQPQAPRIILADPEEWEGAMPANVTAVLESAGRALVAHVLDAGRPTVQVSKCVPCSTHCPSIVP
jgi:hypothetical protein